MTRQSFPVRPIIVILTDFGLRDGYVGIMKGVMAGIVPHAQFIDLTHAIAPQDIAQGSWVLATSYRYFPPVTVFVCVVDPGVGSQRRPLALHAGDWFFVGPDNGLFSAVLVEQPVHTAVVLSNPHYHLPLVSSTFQGRDIFSPVAAHLANGVPIQAVGEQIDPSHLYLPDRAIPRREGAQIHAHIGYIDHFGNLITTIPVHLVPELFSASDIQLTFLSSSIIVTACRRFFADALPGTDPVQPFLYLDSAGYLGVALQNASVASVLRIAVGEPVTLTISEK